METNPNVIFRKAWLSAVESKAFAESDEPAFYFGALTALQAALQGNEKRKYSVVVRNRVVLMHDELYRHITVKSQEK